MSYSYSKMNEMEEILISLELPKKYRGTRTILVLLSIGGLTEASKWSSVSQDFLRIHDVIQRINEYYPAKGGTDKKYAGYAENSRETIRDSSISPLCDLAILESNGEKSNSGNIGYRFTKEFAQLLKCYKTDEWNDELAFFRDNHKTYAEKYDQKKKIDKGLPVSFDGKSFELPRSKHNKLQVAILQEWVPRFAPDSKLLYIGDTKNRQVIKDDNMMNNLGVHVLDKKLMPDIILYNENENHKWILFLEAYTSTGELTVERVNKIRECCTNVREDVELIFVTAFLDMKTCLQAFKNIAWDTEIWIAEEETHMIHKNGDKFLSAHERP